MRDIFVKSFDTLRMVEMKTFKILCRQVIVHLPSEVVAYIPRLPQYAPLFLARSRRAVERPSSSQYYARLVTATVIVLSVYTVKCATYDKGSTTMAPHFKRYKLRRVRFNQKSIFFRLCYPSHLFQPNLT